MGWSVGHVFFQLLILKLTAVSDGHWLAGRTRAASHGLHLVDHFVTLGDLAEDNVLAVQPLSICGANEELRSVGIGSSVGHREAARTEVLAGTTCKAFIGELHAVDRLTAGTVSCSEVATLAHELGDDTVKLAAEEVEWLAGTTDTLLASAQGTKVLGGLGDDILEEFHFDAASRLGADADIKEDQRVDLVDRVERDLPC